MEAFRDRFTAAELLSYKEVSYDEASEEWYAPHDPDEVEREDPDTFIPCLEDTPKLPCSY